MTKLFGSKGLFRMVLAAGAVLLTVIIIYLAGVWYYRDRFIMNTWIEGVYCTGKTVEESDSEFQKAEAPSIRIVDKQGREYLLKTGELSYQEDYTDALQQIMDSQNALLWFLGAQSDAADGTITPVIRFDESKLIENLHQMECVKEASAEPMVAIIFTENGYILEDQTADQVNIIALQDYLVQVIAEGCTDSVIYLENGFYEKTEYTPAQKEVLAQWEKVKAFQEIAFTYDMGEEQVALTASELAGMLLYENGSFTETEDGRLLVNREQTDAYVDALADQYDTYQKERTFTSTRGDEITITKGTYGTKLDRKAEKEYLYAALTKSRSEIHIPEYVKEPYHRGLDDIGDTYIEIDLTEQKMYLYKEGECLVETDVVTGNTSRRWGTPEGIYAVYAKQRNRTLRGADYASFVRYWMPYYGNIGIHDASWRNRFGGTIYQKNGSHGCINTPSEKMKTIYAEVEVGVPVIVFY